MKSKFIDKCDIRDSKMNFNFMMKSLINETIKGSNQLFYSFDNYWWNKAEHKVHINTTSIVGIIPLIKRSSFPKDKFVEIYELLTPKVL